MFPTQRRYMLQQLVGNNTTLLAQMGGSPAEIDSVPIYDGADDEIESGGAEGLAIVGSVADFTAFVKKDSALELMGGFAPSLIPMIRHQDAA